MRAIKITVVGLGFLLCLGTVGCDTTATFRISEVQFDPVAPLRVIGTTPVKRDAGGLAFVPACSAGETAEGMRITFALKSTEQKGTTSGNKDRLVRDGDRISGKIVSVGPGQAISADKFTFGPDNANTIEEVGSLDGAGNSKPLASISPVAVNFVPRTANKNESVAVALLIDHSGSMVGQVDPTHYFEVKTLAGSAPIGERTDKFGKRFVAAGTSLISNLNASDKLIAWTFNEKGLRLACSAVTEVANEPLLAEEQLCFTAQHSLYYNDQDGTGGISDTNNETTQGRTPLWRAVNHAWDFLNQKRTWANQAHCGSH